MAGVTGLREVRYGSGVDAGANHMDLAHRLVEPVLRLRRVQVHRVLALRAGLRRGAGHPRADDRGPRLRLEGQPRRRRLPVLGVRVLRRLRAGLPDGHAAGEVGRRAGHADPQRDHHLRVLRCGLLVQGRDARRRAGADGALQGRRRQRGPQLREGPLRLRLRQPPRPRARADGARVHRRRVAHGELGGGHRVHRPPAARDPGRARHRLDRRDHLLPLHQRGGLRRPEDGAGGVRQQQRRHLRAGLPLAHRVTG